MASASGTHRVSVVDGNEISYGRDGIFVLTSRENVFRNNRFRDLRFAVHYMYADESRSATTIRPAITSATP